MSKIIEAAGIITFIALIFAVTSLLSEFSLKRFLVALLFGAYLGFAGLSFFEPAKWKPQPIWCGLIASLAGIAFVMDLPGPHDLNAFVLAAIIGFVVGVFAPLWVRYM
ncbi:MAG: hypothetical protein P8J78_12960 [Maricaulis sp.]|jgi:ABC-type enterobactin transport system permease subunit|nr:hypothetical protein [Maricaulis sp.]MDG2045514.1 hypothetical protein [Maricaulis sp.]